MESSGKRAEYLALLGFPAGSNPDEFAIEEARMRLCGKLNLPTTSPDIALLDVAKRMGYQPEMAQSDTGTKPKPAADATELANIPRRTTSGLSAMSATKSTQSGIKPLHSRAAGGPKPDSGDEQQAPDAAAREQAAKQQEQSARMHALRTSAKFSTLDKPSIWEKITGIFKKKSDNG